MIARGFKPVGWVAGVAGAALACYMLSLNVAAERAELAKLEWRIIAAKQDIRELQTELGTRGRLQQLESWNANVLALSAPTSAQFLDNELTLARFEQREKTMEERAVVQMASADTPPEVKPQPQVAAPVQYASAPAAPSQPLVHRASLTVEAPKPAAPEAKAEKKASAPVKKIAAEAKAAAPVKTASLEAPAKKPEVEAKAPAKKIAAEAKASAKKATAEAKAQPKKPLIGQDLVKTIGAAAKQEKKSGSAGGQ